MVLVESVVDGQGRVLDRDVEFVSDDPRPGDVRHSVASIEKARQLLDFEPDIGFREGLDRTVDDDGYCCRTAAPRSPPRCTGAVLYTPPMRTGVEPTITLTDEGEWWVARDTETGVTSQGRTRSEALDNLDEALAGYHGDGETPTDEELRELGIDPANNNSRSLDDTEVFE